MLGPWTEFAYKQRKTSSSAVAKRPRDASCLSVVSKTYLQRNFLLLLDYARLRRGKDMTRLRRGLARPRLRRVACASPRAALPRHRVPHRRGHTRRYVRTTINIRITAASDLLVDKILLNSVLLSPIVSGGFRPKPPGQTPPRS